jgi:hypothetical protein
MANGQCWNIKQSWESTELPAIVHQLRFPDTKNHGQIISAIHRFSNYCPMLAPSKPRQGSSKPHLVQSTHSPTPATQMASKRIEINPDTHPHYQRLSAITGIQSPTELNRFIWQVCGSALADRLEHFSLEAIKSLVEATHD